MKTFEEWMDPERRAVTKEEFPGRSFMAIALAWAAWQACAAEYQPEIDWRMEQYTQTLNHLAREKVALQAIIDEARKLAEKWNAIHTAEHEDGSTYKYRIQFLCNCARDLQAVLDRSGARGGSVAENPASSLDNPPADIDRGRT
jgi:hypothetical protein